MRRRDFVSLFLSSAVGAVCANLSIKGLFAMDKEIEDKVKNWVWLPAKLGKSEKEWEELFEEWRDAGIKAILPNTFNGGSANYASKYLPIRSHFLEKILPIAKNAGLEVHAWIFSMPCNIKEIYQNHPEWYAVNRNGEPSFDKPAYVNYYRFLCPNREGTRKHLQTIVSELAEIPDLNGIHLDYIRYPDVILPVNLQPKYKIVQDREYPEYDYCYCEECRAQYKKISGIDPLDLDEPDKEKSWLQFRCDSITSVVNDLLIPIAHKKKKIITAAVFPNWKQVRQEWRKWNLDAVFPMLYHRFYDEDIQWIGQQAKKGINSLFSEASLYSGVYVSSLTPDQMSQILQISLNNGAKGIALFNAFNMKDAHWEALKKGCQGF